MTEKHSPLPWKNDSELIWCREGPLARRPNHPENGQRWDEDAALIVRSVNGLPEAIAALEAADEALKTLVFDRDFYPEIATAKDKVTAALTKLKG